MSIIFTIGYEGSNIHDVLTTLQDRNIEYLLDIRQVPYSSMMDFNTNRLVDSCWNYKITYFWLEKYGMPKHGRDLAWSGKHEEAWKIYRNRINEGIGLDPIIDVVNRQKVSACLMCMEKNYKKCHRHVLTDMLKEHGIESCHLTPAKHSENNLKEFI